MLKIYSNIWSTPLDMPSSRCGLPISTYLSQVKITLISVKPRSQRANGIAITGGTTTR